MLTGLVYAGACGLVAIRQDDMLYFPTRLTGRVALTMAARDGLEPWRDASGQIVGWRRPNAGAAARLVVFHGNAGCALDRGYYAAGFGPLNHGRDWEVFLFEYPGYGAREGKAGREVFFTAGRTAVEALAAADPRPVYVLGESIGSGTASALAGALPDTIAGAVMMIPFARLAEVAAAEFPWLPVGWLLRDKYDNIASLSTYRGRMAFVIAEHDEVVGTDQGLKLHAASAGPKKLIVLAGATHNGFPSEPGAPWFKDVTDFLRN